MKYSIYVPTFNRYDLLRLCLISLRNQNYSDFEVFVHDNGSEKNVAPILAEINDPRFHLSRSLTPTDPSDNAERILHRISGDYFIFLSDDDVLVPDALSRVAEIINNYPDVEYISTGLAYFNHVTGEGISLRIHSGQVLKYPGAQTALAYANGNTAIGAKLPFKLPPDAHPSGIYINTDLIRKTIDIQGRLFVKPFGDVGYLGCLFITPYCFHLDLPLSVIGESPARETTGSKKGQRYRLEKYRPDIERSPLRAITFINLALESHLKVLAKFAETHSEIDLRIRPEFFARHLKEILGDSPIGKQTLMDFFECIPLYAKSKLQFFNFHSICSVAMHICRKAYYALREIFSRQSSEEIRPMAKAQKYKNINEYASALCSVRATEKGPRHD